MLATGADGSERGGGAVLGRTPGQVYLSRLRAFLEEFAGRAAVATLDGPLWFLRREG